MTSALSEQNLYVSFDIAADTDVSGASCSVSMVYPGESDDWASAVAAEPPAAIQAALEIDSPIYDGIQRVWFRVPTGPDQTITMTLNQSGRNTVHGKLVVAGQTFYRRWSVLVPKE
jgi:hypothetical protein